MYDYKIVEQVTRKKKKLSGVLKKTMVFFAVVFVLMGITISQAFMLAGFCLAGLYFIYGTFCQRDYEYTLENDTLTIDVIYGNKYRKTAHELDLRAWQAVSSMGKSHRFVCTMLLYSIVYGFFCQTVYCIISAENSVN